MAASAVVGNGVPSAAAVGQDFVTKMKAAYLSLDAENLKNNYARLIEDKSLTSSIPNTMVLALRQALQQRIQEQADTSVDAQTLFDIVQFALTLAVQEPPLLAYGSVMSAISDIFKQCDVECCERCFAFMERNLHVWKSAKFQPSRNTLLRLCNDLLGRLSRTTDTEFCGRILIFLARCLPLTEKSGLNIVSQFNTQNHTHYDKQPTTVAAPPTTEAEPESDGKTEKGEEMEEGEMADPPASSTEADGAKKPAASDETSTVVVDFHMYEKFWQLQAFFNQPNECYAQDKWDLFKKYSSDVLSLFTNNKLDVSKTQSTDFFAKYLTSQKLIALQTNDSIFRRYVLVQMVIIFQYLKTDTKFKDATKKLTEEQSAWVDTAVDKCYSLLAETYPHGSEFVASVKHIVSREDRWSDWKNKACEDFTKHQVDDAALLLVKRRTRTEFDPNGAVNLGNAELSRLWQQPDNMQACRDTKRHFIPSLETFLQEPLEQSDPNAGIEDEYKHVSDENWQWRCFRLQLAHGVYEAAKEPDGKKSTPFATFYKKKLEIWTRSIAKNIPSLKAELKKQEDRAKEVEARRQEREAEQLQEAEENRKRLAGEACEQLARYTAVVASMAQSRGAKSWLAANARTDEVRLTALLLAHWLADEVCRAHCIDMVASHAEPLPDVCQVHSWAALLAARSYSPPDSASASSNAAQQQQPSGNGVMVDRASYIADPPAMPLCSASLVDGDVIVTDAACELIVGRLLTVMQRCSSALHAVGRKNQQLQEERDRARQELDDERDCQIIAQYKPNPQMRSECKRLRSEVAQCQQREKRAQAAAQEAKSECERHKELARAFENRAHQAMTECKLLELAKHQPVQSQPRSDQQAADQQQSEQAKTEELREKIEELQRLKQTDESLQQKATSTSLSKIGEKAKDECERMKQLAEAAENKAKQALTECEQARLELVKQQLDNQLTADQQQTGQAKTEELREKIEELQRQKQADESRLQQAKDECERMKQLVWSAENKAQHAETEGRLLRLREKIDELQRQKQADETSLQQAKDECDRMKQLAQAAESKAQQAMTECEEARLELIKHSRFNQPPPSDPSQPPAQVMTVCKLACLELAKHRPQRFKQPLLPDPPAPEHAAPSSPPSTPCGMPSWNKDWTTWKPWTDKIAERRFDKLQRQKLVADWRAEQAKSECVRLRLQLAQQLRAKVDVELKSEQMRSEMERLTKALTESKEQLEELKLQVTIDAECERLRRELALQSQSRIDAEQNAEQERAPTADRVNKDKDRTPEDPLRLDNQTLRVELTGSEKRSADLEKVGKMEKTNEHHANLIKFYRDARDQLVEQLTGAQKKCANMPSLRKALSHSEQRIEQLTEHQAQQQSNEQQQPVVQNRTADRTDVATQTTTQQEVSAAGDIRSWLRSEVRQRPAASSAAASTTAVRPATALMYSPPVTPDPMSVAVSDGSSVKPKPIRFALPTAAIDRPRRLLQPGRASHFDPRKNIQKIISHSDSQRDERRLSPIRSNLLKSAAGRQLRSLGLLRRNADADRHSAGNANASVPVKYEPINDGYELVIDTEPQPSQKRRRTVEIEYLERATTDSADECRPTTAGRSSSGRRSRRRRSRSSRPGHGSQAESEGRSVSSASTSKATGAPITDELRSQAAVVLAAHWLALAKQMGWSKDTISAHSDKQQTSAETIELILNQWLEREGDGANTGKLRYWLQDAQCADHKIESIIELAEAKWAAELKADPTLADKKDEGGDNDEEAEPEPNLEAIAAAEEKAKLIMMHKEDEKATGANIRQSPKRSESRTSSSKSSSSRESAVAGSKKARLSTSVDAEIEDGEVKDDADRSSGRKKDKRHRPTAAADDDSAAVDGKRARRSK